MSVFLQINENNNAGKEGMQGNWNNNGAMYSTFDEA